MQCRTRKMQHRLRMGRLARAFCALMLGALCMGLAASLGFLRARLRL